MFINTHSTALMYSPHSVPSVGLDRSHLWSQYYSISLGHRQPESINSHLHSKEGK